ncbi:uncharacterized protein LOC113495924 [Trichoplusia ni]|uniref:Odorant receptor n=1 Tax=Trichoplusia ni TaxID=7111 RepID=A0A7E5VR18_TRINI|nr:uncharacterized protein LOC113495924 [Trichoplusia ni]
MADLLLFLMIFHIYGHFKILLNLMATFPRPAATVSRTNNTKQENLMFSESELKDVCVRIKECIDYHNYLLEFTKSMSDAFGPMLLVYFSFHQVSCCLLLLECAQMVNKKSTLRLIVILFQSAEALIRYGPLTVIIFQALIQLCIIFELIGTVVRKIPTVKSSQKVAVVVPHLFCYRYSTYICSCCICLVDLTVFLIIFHVYGHFKILLNHLVTFPTPADTVDDTTNTMLQNYFYSESEEKDVFIKLKDCITYHNFLLDFTNAMTDTFGPTLFVYLWFHQLSCCLLLLECAQMSPEALMCYGPLTVIVFESLIQMNVIFEMIGSVSEKLKDAVYQLPWQCMDVKNRKVVLFFLMNVQTPVHVKAMGLTRVGVDTMAAILKTSVTYFAFLRTVPAE